MNLKELKIEAISRENPDFPYLLKEIPNPPSQIYVLGKLPNEEKPRIAIVGTRKATFEGRLIAKKIAQRLAEIKIVVVSGLAMGIDTAAHEGALAGNGETIAVLACGLDAIYPRQNENLAKKLLNRAERLFQNTPQARRSCLTNF